MISLLDVNVLIALADANHVHGEAALNFFERVAIREGWATCPLTENAFLRILANPKYPHGSGDVQLARRQLLSLRSQPGHQFWADDLSLSDSKLFPALPDPKSLTDLYLLGLAARREARLVTFDEKIDPKLVHNGAAAYHLLSS